jgi:hypothetical protein
MASGWLAAWGVDFLGLTALAESYMYHSLLGEVFTRQVATDFLLCVLAALAYFSREGPSYTPSKHHPGGPTPPLNIRVRRHQGEGSIVLSCGPWKTAAFVGVLAPCRHAPARPRAPPPGLSAVLSLPRRPHRQAVT